MEVIVTTPVERSNTLVREIFMTEKKGFNVYARRLPEPSNRSSTARAPVEFQRREYQAGNDEKNSR